MGVKVQGLLGAEDMLLQVESTGRKRVVRKLIREGEKIMHVARKMAPRDFGNLEHAIKMTPDPETYTGRERDDGGRFTRTEVTVYVDMDAPVPERPGKTVGDYAYEAHEHITPMGPKNLGDHSVEKQLMTPDVEVGGGFMERAANLVEEGIDEALQEALGELMSGL